MHARTHAHTHTYTHTGRTLRRGGAALGRAVGNFFGVTDESQHGSANTVGWEAVSVNRAEVYIP